MEVGVILLSCFCCLIPNIRQSQHIFYLQILRLCSENIESMQTDSVKRTLSKPGSSDTSEFSSKPAVLNRQSKKTINTSF